MKTDILFIQGGGNDGYEADTALVASLQQALGVDYAVHYPQLQTVQTAPDFGWPQQIGTEISQIDRKLLLVAHSLGASMLLKYLSEHEVNNNIEGIFLIATPFWSGEENWVQGLKLQDDFAVKLPKAASIFCITHTMTKKCQLLIWHLIHKRYRGRLFVKLRVGVINLTMIFL